MSEIAEVQTVVIGAGVVGLAIARALARAGHEVIILEAQDAIGTETSSRNSEVIHAGIYYPTGSLKARLCVEGKHLLYAYCEERGVPFRQCGKLIVATDDAQVAGLDGIIKKAAENNVCDLELLEADQAQRMEPALRCLAAAWSPSTGIVDSHSLMLAYQGEAEDNGAMIAFNAPVIGGEAKDNAIALEVGGDTPMRLRARHVINAAGLHAQRIASSLDGIRAEGVPPRYLCKGNYFTVSGKNPFSRLIYPMPQQAGLGVHVTIDIGGGLRFGPDVEWIDDLNYDVDPIRAESFYEAIRRYWPGLVDGALEPGYSGIRPKLVAKGEAAADFTIHGPEETGIQGLINLYGIESPGLTASLSIAHYVHAIVEG